jgi:hypothetical protein
MNDDKRLVTHISESQAVHDTKIWAGAVAGIAVLGIVGYAVYLVRAYLPVLGFAILVALGILLVVGVVTAVVWLLHYVFKATAFDIGEFGTVMQWFGKKTLYAPMTTNTVKVSQRKGKVTVTPEVSSIIELIETGVICIGQLAMHMGFEQEKGGLLPVVDAWPGTFAIAGRGRSGKTRRVISIIFQALIGGARVFVCDPHATKPDGLAKELEALAPWIVFVRGAENCASAARTFRNEMNRRVKEGIDGGVQPWLIIFDEWSALMTGGLPDEDKEVMIEVVQECSTQYAGYLGFAGIIGQKWLAEECGGTTIRRSLHKVFVHQLDPDYAKFLLPSRYAKKANELLIKECFYQVAGEVKRIVSITVPDDSHIWLADWLMEHMPPESMLPTVEQKRPLIPEQVAQHVKALPLPQTQPYEHENNTDGKGVNAGEEPVEPVQDGKGFTVDGEGFTAEIEPPYTPSEETQVVLAAQKIASENGGKVTRQAIRDHLGWNVRKHHIVKAVCDKHGIAKI